MSEFDDIGQELHAMRAQPDPEFARELDRRAADWLRKKRGRSPFLHPLRIAIPAAAAAAAVVVALVVSGGGEERGSELEVAVVPDRGTVEALGGGAAPEALDRDAPPRAPEGAFSAPEKQRVEPGEPVRLRYFVSGRVEGTVELAGREARLEIEPGAGQLEISTEGLPEGIHQLELTLPPLRSQRQRIEIGG